MTNIAPHFLSFAGVPNTGNGDLVLWMNLLGKGNAIYLTTSLSCFRMHAGQEQAQAEWSVRGKKALADQQAAGRRMGLVLDGDHSLETVRPLPVLPWWSQAAKKSYDKAISFVEHVSHSTHAHTVHA